MAYLGFVDVEEFIEWLDYHGRLAQILLEKGADVNAQGGSSSNALKAAYHEALIGDVQVEGDLYEWAANAANATLLTRIGGQLFEKTGWVPATTRLNLQGLNVRWRS